MPRSFQRSGRTTTYRPPSWGAPDDEGPGLGNALLERAVRERAAQVARSRGGGGLSGLEPFNAELERLQTLQASFCPPPQRCSITQDNRGQVSDGPAPQFSVPLLRSADVSRNHDPHSATRLVQLKQFELQELERSLDACENTLAWQELALDEARDDVAAEERAVAEASAAAAWKVPVAQAASPQGVRRGHTLVLFWPQELTRDLPSQPLSLIGTCRPFPCSLLLARTLGNTKQGALLS